METQVNRRLKLTFDWEHVSTQVNLSIGWSYPEAREGGRRHTQNFLKVGRSVWS
jgi:hypothetical protein